MGRKISDENSCGHRLLFCFSMFLFFLRPIIFNSSALNIVSVSSQFFFVFKILNLLTLLKQEGAQWQEPIFVLIALCVNLLISGIFYSQKDKEP